MYLVWDARNMKYQRTLKIVQKQNSLNHYKPFLTEHYFKSQMNMIGVNTSVNRKT